MSVYTEPKLLNICLNKYITTKQYNFLDSLLLLTILIYLIPIKILSRITSRTQSINLLLLLLRIQQKQKLWRTFNREHGIYFKTPTLSLLLELFHTDTPMLYTSGTCPMQYIRQRELFDTTILLSRQKCASDSHMTR